MREAIRVLERAKRSAKERLTSAEADKDKRRGENHAATIRHAIKELDEGIEVLRNADAVQSSWYRLGIELGRKDHVQVLNHKEGKAGNRGSRTGRNRRDK